MAEITQSNYTATNEYFVWADSGADQFQREHVAEPAKALANHDHSSGHGLPVARVGTASVPTAGVVDDAITAAKLRDSADTDSDRAVTTNHIRNNAVTAAKLAAAAATGAALGSDVIKTTGTQAIAAGLTLTSPVLTGLIDVQGILLQAIGAAVASAGTTTLGDDGNAFHITGTASITTITAKPAGTPVILLFDSTAKVLTTGNVLSSKGTFFGQAGAILELVSTGSGWLEVNRIFDIVPGGRFYRATNQAIVTATDTTIIWNAVDPSMPDPLVVLNTGTGVITPPRAGLYELAVAIKLVNSSTGGVRTAWVEKNSVLLQYLFAGVQANHWGNPLGMPAGIVWVRVNGTTDTIRVRINQTAGVNVDVDGGIDDSNATLTWIAP